MIQIRISTLIFRLERLIPVICVYLMCVYSIDAQMAQYNLSTENPVSLKIIGESTLHDYTVECPVVIDYPTSLELNLNEGGSISGFNFKVEVAAMESGRGSTMNNKTYKALKKDEYPYIIFTQSQEAQFSGIDNEGNTSFEATGKLDLAGVQKDIAVPVTFNVKEGVLKISGNKELLMTDFSIKPPSAMFGQIKTKDKIVVDFSITYVQVNP